MTGSNTDSPGIVHFWTGESLPSIIEGLDLNSNDKVLAISGSGDQALAILEYAGRVEARDKNSSQVEFLKRRIELLRSKDVSLARKYVIKSELAERNNFFDSGQYEIFHRQPSEDYLNDERLMRIRQKLDCLDIVLGNVFDGNLNGANKVYLSNALSHSGPWITSNLASITRTLPINGLVYIADEHTAKLLRLRGPEWDKPLLQKGIVRDEELSLKAKNHDTRMFKPAVYRKVEEER